jgi:hypothetical protein
MACSWVKYGSLRPSASRASVALLATALPLSLSVSLASYRGGVFLDVFCLWKNIGNTFYTFSPDGGVYFGKNFYLIK